MKKTEKKEPIILPSAENILDFIKPKSNIFVSSCCAEPQLSVDFLVKNKSELPEGIKLFSVIIGSRDILCEVATDSPAQFIAITSSRKASNLIYEGKADYLPTSIWQLSKWINEEVIPVDIAIIQASPPNSEGLCSLGISVDFMLEAVKKAEIVIAEINENMPQTAGDNSINWFDIDFVLNCNYPLLEIPISSTLKSAMLDVIASYVAELIPNGATIEIGPGALAGAILRKLVDKKDLGVHSGMLTDSIIPLIEKGIINNRLKNVKKGKTVATQLIGTKNFYNYASNNKNIEIHPCTFTHNPAILGKIHNFRAINFALEIDLLGQVNVDTIPTSGLQVGGVGGLLDFAVGALMSPSGSTIFAFPSTAGEGKVSCIVAHLSERSVASIPATLVDYVVTEYGTAKISGKSRKERAEALIKIAHPNFREKLERSFIN